MNQASRSCVRLACAALVALLAACAQGSAPATTAPGGPRPALATPPPNIMTPQGY